jgi:hypothetical protein
MRKGLVALEPPDLEASRWLFKRRDIYYIGGLTKCPEEWQVQVGLIANGRMKPLLLPSSSSDTFHRECGLMYTGQRSSLHNYYYDVKASSNVLSPGFTNTGACSAKQQLINSKRKGTTMGYS